jgi:hypothetical protein
MQVFTEEDDAAASDGAATGGGGAAIARGLLSDPVRYMGVGIP